MATQPREIEALGRRLLETREKRFLSQAEAAEQLGVSTRRYQSWEWGEVTNPQPRARRRIEEWLS